jgi:hypothetical protein
MVVIVVVIMIVVMLVVIAVVVAVTVMVVVPVVVMLNAAAVACPVPYEVSFSIVMRRHPSGALIRGLSPIARVPFVMMAYRIPIPLHPDESWTGLVRLVVNHSRWRRRADGNAN